MHWWKITPLITKIIQLIYDTQSATKSSVNIYSHSLMGMKFLIPNECLNQECNWFLKQNSQKLLD